MPTVGRLLGGSADGFIRGLAGGEPADAVRRAVSAGAEQRGASALTAGAEPPCGWRSVTKLDMKCCKDKNRLNRILDSKVGSSDLLDA